MSKQVRLHRVYDSWGTGHLHEWICDAGLSRLFDIPSHVNVIYLCLSETETDGAVCLSDFKDKHYIPFARIGRERRRTEIMWCLYRYLKRHYEGKPVWAWIEYEEPTP